MNLYKTIFPNVIVRQRDDAKLRVLQDCTTPVRGLGAPRLVPSTAASGVGSVGKPYTIH